MAKATAPQQTTAIAPVNQDAADIELLKSYGIDPTDVTGKENLTQDDLKLSRLAIAQKMSHQLNKRDEQNYIEGLEEGEFYDTVTKQNFGPGPLTFTLIAPVRKHAKKLDEEGNVLEWDVPFDSPRCEFTTGPNGERNPPECTRFYDFLAILNDSPSEFPTVISMKRSQVPVAKSFMTLYARKPGPVFAYSYTIRTVPQKGAKGEFMSYSINLVGVAPREIIEHAKALHAKFKDVKYRTVEPAEGREVDADGDAPPF